MEEGGRKRREEEARVRKRREEEGRGGKRREEERRGGKRTFSFLLFFTKVV
jgi:hypothetical protein